MDVNRTLIEDVIAGEFPTPSTSSFTMDDALHTRNPLIDGTVANNVTGIGNTNVSFISPRNHKFFENMFSSMEALFSESAWVVYTVTGVVAIAVIIIVCFIVVWIVKHKKRIIQYDHGPVLDNTYDGGFHWKNCCYCCVPKLEKNDKLPARQNSASNLDPYRRPPLPPIGRKHDEYDSYINVFNRTDVLDGLKKPDPVDERTLAVNIRSIRGVPHVHLQPEEYRKLPPLKTQYDLHKEHGSPSVHK